MTRTTCLLVAHLYPETRATNVKVAKAGGEQVCKGRVTDAICIHKAMKGHPRFGSVSSMINNNGLVQLKNIPEVNYNDICQNHVKEEDRLAGFKKLGYSVQPLRNMNTRESGCVKLNHHEHKLTQF